ncbi:hypothetical protein C8F04DRAFT_1180592 [Mycena alexandri]|uniref:Uncharacterized protein n=1 Tax=Mycena alexandri TaxID=1745969 RepID=A0AAD6T2F5_9AGAR|nr:hypothetical protein C8F04DRAFT_1180592 [Mycena alexandri]
MSVGCSCQDIDRGDRKARESYVPAVGAHRIELCSRDKHDVSAMPCHDATRGDCTGERPRRTKESTSNGRMPKRSSIEGGAENREKQPLSETGQQEDWLAVAKGPVAVASGIRESVWARNEHWLDESRRMSTFSHRYLLNEHPIPGNPKWPTQNEGSAGRMKLWCSELRRLTRLTVLHGSCSNECECAAAALVRVHHARPAFGATRSLKFLKFGMPDGKASFPYPPTSHGEIRVTCLLPQRANARITAPHRSLPNLRACAFRPIYRQRTYRIFFVRACSDRKKRCSPVVRSAYAGGVERVELMDGYTLTVGRKQRAVGIWRRKGADIYLYAGRPEMRRARAVLVHTHQCLTLGASSDSPLAGCRNAGQFRGG